MKNRLFFPVFLLLWLSTASAQPFSPLHDTLSVLTVKGIYEKVLKQTKAPGRCGEALLKSRSLAGMLERVSTIEDCNPSERAPENGNKTRALLDALRRWRLPDSLTASPDTATQLATAISRLPEVEALFEKKVPEQKAFEKNLAAHLQPLLKTNEWAALVTIPAPALPAAPASVAMAPASDVSETAINWTLLAALSALALAALLGLLFWNERKKRLAAEATRPSGAEPFRTPPPPENSPEIPAVSATPSIPLHVRLAHPAEPASPLPPQTETPVEQPTPLPPAATPQAPAVLPVSPAEPPVRLRYFSFPDGQGFSDPAGLDKFRPGVSVFELRINGNQATFGVADRPEAMQQALSDDLQYLNPVCVYGNPFSAAATRIATQEPGVAHLQGEMWVISQKAVIQFS